MGKASSNKSVARAAKAGGGKARAAGERNVVFPAVLGLVVLLGTLLVVVARGDRQAQAEEAPRVNTGVAGATGDHWHSSYGFYVCDAFESDLPEYTAPQNGGLHTHGDGLIHIHPFSPARSGKNATLVNWLNDAGDALGGGATLSDSELHIPRGDTYTEGEDTCEGQDGDPIVQVAVWHDAADALAGEDPDEIVTDDFGSIRFEDNGEAFTIAFAPEGAELPPPSTTDRLASVDPEDLGSTTDTTVAEDIGDATVDSTVPETSDTTVADGDPTATTVADAAPTTVADQ